ncbi:hypothetical protein ACH3VS_36295 [Streptomyces sp. WSLK1-3]
MHERQFSAVAIAVVFVVVVTALTGLLTHPRLPAWTKTTAFCTVPAAALS